MLLDYFHLYLILAYHVIFVMNGGLTHACGAKDICPYQKIISRYTVPNFVECPCDDLLKLGGVIDESIATIESVFKESRIAQMIFKNTKHLPAKTFRGCYVYSLIFNGSDLHVDENVFEGIYQLNELHVEQSAIKTIPDFRFVKDYITIINIESSHLSSLEGENLRNLNLVEELKFSKNAIRYIDPNVFKGTENVKTLDLSHNLLTSIPENLLNTMKSLSVFAARHNNLLTVDNLFAIAHPKIILLEHNNITDIDLSHFSSIDTLNLSYNLISEINLPPTRDVPDYNKTQDVESVHSFKRHRRQLPSVYYLQKLMKTLAALKNRPGALSDLELNPWLIEGQHIKGVKHINLIGNKLKSLSYTLRATQVVELKVGGNQIQYLTEGDFLAVGHMQKLELFQNQIQWIDRNTFQPIKMHIYSLDMSFNNIKSLNGSVRDLSQLQKLILAHNYIEIFEKEDFKGLSGLFELYLQHNHIKSLGQLQQISQLRHLNITQNNISLIKVDQLPETLRYINLAGNQFQCDCHLQPFITLINKNGSLSVDSDLCTLSDTWNMLEKQTDCPEMCTCSCDNNGVDSFMFLDCSSKNLSTIPPFLRNNLTQIEVKMEDRVLGISLENNNLVSLDAIELPPDLYQLYLANNTLRSLPESIFNKLLNLDQVSLSGNPWKCDCNTLKFKKWLSAKNNIIRDIDDIRCGSNMKEESHLEGKIIWRLSDLDLCPIDERLIISVFISIISLASFSAATMYLYNKYNLNIKLFFYDLGFTFVKEKYLDISKRFDAFISFSSEDGEFVYHEIISEIKKKAPYIELTDHIRHFMPGEFIYDNIINAVQNSKVTVLVLSRKFLESEWCLVEFRLAHIYGLKDREHRIIVIKFGELPKKILSTLQSFLKRTAFLTWGEKNFWKKLLFLLPNGSRVGSTPNNNVREVPDILIHNVEMLTY